MPHSEGPIENILQSLQERAKELSCLYRVDEILGQGAASAQAIYRQLVEALPSGWQYSEETRATVTIDGETVTPDLAQINFLERTLKSSRVIDPPEEIDLNAAILGAIFVYPTEGLPENVQMEWDLFNEKIRTIPVSAVDQAAACSAATRSRRPWAPNAPAATARAPDMAEMTIHMRTFPRLD